MKTLMLIFCALLLSPMASAKLFANSYVSFELPSNWKCNMEGTEWVCKTSLARKGQKLDAIIILTAKEAGPTDTLGAYQAHLKSPKPLRRRGKVTYSKVKHMRSRTINNQAWVDGLHSGSEAANFYTRYLATIKNKVAVLVTFSAHIRQYTKYSGQFLKAINSLKVIAGPGLLNSPNANLAPRNQNIDQNIGTYIPPVGMGDDEDFPEESSTLLSGGKIKILGLALLLAGLVAYFLSRNKA